MKNQLLSIEGDYQDTFQQRGHHYDQAMQLCPDARDREFKQLFTGVDRSRLRRVLDIPSGGGYLQRYLSAQTELYSLDPCENFRALAGGGSMNIETLALPDGHFDAVVCLAALHHISNKQAFVEALWRALAPGGYLLIADVAAGSGEAKFLDEFAGRFNQTGHAGQYWSAGLAPEYLAKRADAELQTYAMRECDWHFSEQHQLLAFCRHLFGLAAVDDKALLAALQEYVGISHNSLGVQLHWQLVYLQCQKA